MLEQELEGACLKKQPGGTGLLETETWQAGNDAGVEGAGANDALRRFYVVMGGMTAGLCGCESLPSMDTHELRDSSAMTDHRPWLVLLKKGGGCWGRRQREQRQDA